MSATQLDQLKQITTVVADTGDFESMKVYQPQDATTNPSLILQAAAKPEYRPLVEQAVAEQQATGLTGPALTEAILDRILILFGLEILKIVPGRVSTEIDARLSFDTEASLGKAREIIRLYEANGIDRERILVKIASTWEGLSAAKVLQSEGINCNLTLLFSLTQAVVAAENGVRLISPFVGRLDDIHLDGMELIEDIRTIYDNYGFETQILAASIRSVNHIAEAARIGADVITAPPAVIKKMAEHPLTDKGLESFLSDWKKTGQKIL